MARNNYQLQAQQAKQRFLCYDQEALIRKLHLAWDQDWLYTRMLAAPYRIARATSHIQRQENGTWLDGDRFEEVMTLLDLVCDSREDRFLTHRFRDMRDFGLQFHTTLLENTPDPWAKRFHADPAGFNRACQALGGVPFPYGDTAYAIELFDGLSVVLQLWLGDEEFPPRLRLLWDENALMYLRYETMYFAKALLLDRLGAALAGSSSKSAKLVQI